MVNLGEVRLIPRGHLGATPLVVVTTLLSLVQVLLEVCRPLEDSQGLRDLEVL